VLADEVGLGKKVQIVSCLSAIWDQIGVAPFLVVVSDMNLTSWSETFSKWAPHLSVVTWESSPTSREIIKTYEFFGSNSTNLKAHVVIISIEMLLQEAQILRAIKWEGMVLEKDRSLLDSTSAIRKELSSGWHSMWKIVSSSK
jgi:SNF2 family DNA or RNA helicase